MRSPDATLTLVSCVFADVLFMLVFPIEAFPTETFPAERDAPWAFAALCAGARTDPAHAAAPLSLTFAIANEMTGTSIMRVPAMASDVVPALRITSAASSVTPP